MSDYYKAKIGLFLGSFNPFHVGHLELVKESFNRGMSEVWVIPAMSNPWKNERPIGIEHGF
jgi:cytidyltransferase-like protein